MIANILLGTAFTTALALGALKKKAVTISGAIAGFCVGIIIFIGGRFFFWTILLTFFLSSTILGKLLSNRASESEKLIKRGRTRDWIQVLANAGPGTFWAIAYLFTAENIFMVAYIASFASATADTWSSEGGKLSKQDPVSLTRKIRVPRGISGGVSVIGTFFALAGSLLIALITFLFLRYAHLTPELPLVKIITIALLSGFAGSIIDSLLGDTLQAIYLDAHGALTEKPYSHLGENRLCRGVAWINNDTVNILSNSIVSLSALALAAV